MSTPVTVVGLGAMGRALATALLDAGHPTTVWNRSPGKDTELVARGAHRAADAREAVTASPLVIVCLLDYDASDALLEPLADALAGRVLVNLTSDTPERSRKAAEWATGHGIDYLDGAIMVPTPVVGRPEALILFSGSHPAHEAHQETLKALAGNVPYLGADAGTAAVYDLAMLNLFYSTFGGVLRSFAMVDAEGVGATDFAPFLSEIINIMPPIIAGTAAEIAEGSYAGGEANLAMMTAGIEHVLHAGRAKGIDMTGLDAVKADADRALDRGFGEHGFSSIFEVLKRS
ncbi:NAD(P)-binding domain-containing protein [Streptomyces sp. LX-29]|uniref:NAD(P)-dependent oxidoreductase n=1 Tax=Streptomyces sp. LX-29 TaxID=2900152 RepID=UPI00240D0EE4|nr:NAD(P)-binding domain-containing protein [Streptomyces sp. LX-29]WFB09012.1 NAD(P)-binding domain-containing protein [Streptomyces sp. LX-29]